MRQRKSKGVLKPSESVPELPALSDETAAEFEYESEEGDGEAAAVLEPITTMPPGAVSVPLAELNTLPLLVSNLQELQRQRRVNIKHAVRISNGLTSAVANVIGYRPGMTKEERDRYWKEAARIITTAQAGEEIDESIRWLEKVIWTTTEALDGFYRNIGVYDKTMTGRAEKLPVAWWVHESEQRGFSPLSLGIVVGEAGDLSRFQNPAKLWKWMASAPVTINGETKMPATWRAQKGLSKLDWTEAKYNPRRRSIGYMIALNFKRQGDRQGIYWRRYDEAHERAAELHPDWTPKHLQFHSLLLVSKLLYKRLWCAWTGADPNYVWKAAQLPI